MSRYQTIEEQQLLQKYLEMGAIEAACHTAEQWDHDLFKLRHVDFLQKLFQLT